MLNDATLQTIGPMQRCPTFIRHLRSFGDVVLTSLFYTFVLFTLNQHSGECSRKEENIIRTRRSCICRSKYGLSAVLLNEKETLRVIISKKEIKK